jgi:hypothetical protein
MKRWVLCLIFMTLFAVPLAIAADGTFLGKIVDPPANAPDAPGWIFVQGRNHMLRRVEVAHAEVLFGEDIPVSQRHKCNSECLSSGQEVRVTAHQDSDGEWRAKRVEILKIANKTAESSLTSRNTWNLHGFYKFQLAAFSDFCIASPNGEI